MIAYSLIGLIMILSASSIAAVLRYQKPSNYFFLRQVVSLAGGYALGLIMMNIPTKKYRYFSRIMMYIMILNMNKKGKSSWFILYKYQNTTVNPYKNLSNIVLFGVLTNPSIAYK